MTRLIRLFEIDIETPVGDPQTWDGLLAECSRCVEPMKQHFSIPGGSGVPGESGTAGGACEAALLVRLWRDVRVDVIGDGRVYLPRDLAAKHGLDLPLMRKALTLDTERGMDGDLRNSNCNCLNGPGGGLLAVLPGYRKVMRDLVARTDGLLTQNEPPPDPSRVRHADYRRMVYESRATLRLIARNNYDTLTRRPKLSAVSKAWMGIRLRLPG